MSKPGNRRRWIAVGATSVVGLLVLITSLSWPNPKPSAPRERQYRSITACLLTDSDDLNGRLAKASWDGMQAASIATRIQVQHLAINGAQTPENGVTFYNTLGVQHCAAIVAAGELPVAAMQLGYQTFPNTKQVAVGGTVNTTSIVTVDTTFAETIAAAVKQIVETL